MNDKVAKWSEECKSVGFTWIEKVDGNYSMCSCDVCGHVDNYQQGCIRRGEVKCSHCHETKMREECSAVGLTWIAKVDGAYSKCSCNVCGHVDNYAQAHIRRGNVKCSHCYEAKMREECKAVGFTWVEKVDKRHSKCSCNVCGHVDNYHQGNIRGGNVKCSNCHNTKMREECSAVGLTWIEKVDKCHSKCSCNVCGHVDNYAQAHIRRGGVKCTSCQIIKYKQAAKQGWTFINHYRENNHTYINTQHNCSDTIVKVKSGNYLKGAYDCHHCMHTHFSDPSYFYVIQVGDIIKLGISNRPDQRYKQYGLPDDSTIIEHLRIPLETKRDALVVESYAKQLVKDYKIPSDAAKQVFTKSGHNECYDIECLPMLMSI